MDDAANGGLVAVDLADVLARLGHHADAEGMAAIAAELAADFDVEAQVGWRTASARARSALGDGDSALRLVARHAERLDACGLHDATRGLDERDGGCVRNLGIAERRDRARLEAARKIYAAKGHLVGERQVRRSGSTSSRPLSPRSDARR